MPQITTNPEDISETIVNFVLKTILPSIVFNTVGNLICSMIINTLQKSNLKPKSIFEKLSPENQDKISKYSSKLNSAFVKLCEGLTIGNYCTITLSESAKKAWTELFDEFKVKKD